MKTNKLLIIPGTLVSLTAISGLLLSSTITHADGNSSTTDAISITVNSACTITGGPTGESTTDNTYSATIDPGTYSEISGSKLVTICNDNLGYSIYAIGFSGDSYDSNTHTDLIGVGSIGNIQTGTSGSNSYWAMKLEAVTGVTPPTILNSFDNYHVIPSTYTQIAKQETATVSPSSAGASVQTKYKVNISSSQAAGSYTGKVKYTMVHPNNAPAPKPQPAPPTSCNTPVPGVTYMQDITSSNKATILGNMTPGNAYYLRDNRDEEPYCVSILADNNLWMLDNLRLDITDSTILNSLTTTNTHVDAPSLISLKSGNRAAGNQYADGPIAQWDANNTTNYYNRAQANAESKNTTVTSYGNGSGKIGVYYNYCAASAGFYCYDEGVATGDTPYDLCPANWRIPTNTEHNTIWMHYNTTTTATDQASLQYNLSLPLSGYFDSDSARYQGRYGHFWSSSFFSDLGKNKMYELFIESNAISPSAAQKRINGFSLRCLLNV